MLTDEDVLALDRRAREVGRRIGWDLQFVVAGNPEFVGLVAGPADAGTGPGHHGGLVVEAERTDVEGHAREGNR